MKVTKIKIKNLFGITEQELDGRSVEFTGTNGTGKTSIIDAIKYALTNNSERDFIIKKGATEGEIFIESGSDLFIDKKKRTTKADYKSVKENGREIKSPENFLKSLFTPLQLNPIEFAKMNKKEQNRIILDMIEFDWDLNWIKEQFGEIPENINYEQNILQVLNDIQADNSPYFLRRQDLNRAKRNQLAFVEEIADSLPTGYNAEKWRNYNLSETYRKLEEIRHSNTLIERAKAFKDSYDNKKRGLEAEKEIAKTANEKEMANEKESLIASIEKMKAEIEANEDKLRGLKSKLEDKNKIAEAEFNEKLAKLEKDMGAANEYVDKEVQATQELEDEARTAEEMKKYINEYDRMLKLQNEIEELEELSQELTEKIEKARTLPGEILKTATLPLEGLTVENGTPLINGLPVTNLSEGEKLELCVDVAISRPSNLQIILIDGAEKLSDENREKLYKKCKEKGLQFVATRTTNDDELQINYL